MNQFGSSSFGGQAQFGGLNQGQNQGQNQGRYNSGALQSMMSQGGAGFGFGAQSGFSQGGYGNNTFGQFGTNPQQVRQDIQQDLAYGQGSMSSAQAGSLRGQAGMGYGMQGGYGNSAFGQFSTNPQQVRQDIQQDLAYGQSQGSMSSAQRGNFGGQTGFQGGAANTGLMAQFSTNPQQVRQDIQQDLAYGQGQGSMSSSQGGFGGQSGMGYQGGYGNSTFGQFSTNPQQVRQDIQQDLAYGQNQGSMSSAQGGSFGAQAGMAYGMQGGYGNSTFGQFSTNPQQVRQDIQQDLTNASNNQGVGSYGAQSAAFQNGAANTGLMAQFSTNPQQVRQDIQQDLAYGQSQGSMSQFGSSR